MDSDCEIPRVVKTEDVVENIFSFLDTNSLHSVEGCYQLWADVIVKTLLWKKLALRLSKLSQYNKDVLQLKGLDDKFEDKNTESAHFKQLCIGLDSLKLNWKNKKPEETLLGCEALDLQSHNVTWEPFWLNQYNGWICGFKFDTQHLIVGVIDTVQVWDIKTKKCLSILQTPPDDIVRGVDIALNALDMLGNIIVVGSNEGIIRVWELDTARFSKRLDCSDGGAVNSVKFGGENLLFSGHDEGQVMIWTVLSCDIVNLVKVIEDHSNITWCLDISDKFLASCSEDTTIAVYNHPGDSNNFQMSYKVVGHQQAVTCLKLQGELLVTGSRDKTVRLWRLQSLDYVALIVLEGHQELLHYVQMDPERIFSSDDDGELIIWDLMAAQGCNGHQPKKIVVRQFNFEERGAVDCIQVRGSQMFTSYDDFGKIAIHDFW